MQKIKLYLTKNIMYLLLILSIHTVYCSQSTGPIFATVEAKIENDQRRVIMTCTSGYALKQFDFLSFQQYFERHNSYIVAHYQTNTQNHIQIIYENSQLPELKLTDPIIDTNRPKMREIQFIFPYAQS